VHLHQVLQCLVDSLLQPHQVVLAAELTLVELTTRLDGRYLVLVCLELLDSFRVALYLILVGVNLLLELELLLSVTLLGQFDFLDLALQHLGLLN
jgi:hypothetical protein